VSVLLSVFSAVLANKRVYNSAEVTLTTFKHVLVADVSPSLSVTVRNLEQVGNP